MKNQIKTTLPTIYSSNSIGTYGMGDDAILSQYMREIQKFPILSEEQEYEYATNWIKHHDNLSAEKLIASHLRMVASVAYDFKNYGIPISDLIASGNMGLMIALQKYDPERGNRFSTYATYWVYEEIYNTILNNWSMVRIGNSAQNKKVFFNLTKAKKELGIFDNQLSDEQIKKIATHLGVSESYVEKISVRMGARDVSLNAPLSSDSDATDMLSNLADNRESIEDTVENFHFKRDGLRLLKKHLDNLPERDREILKARRLSDPAVTLESLSQKYGISRERIRQIEERAFNNLRNAMLNDTNSVKKISDK